MRQTTSPMIACVLLASALAAGCGERPAAAPQSAVEEPAYAAPPVVTRVYPRTGGGLTIEGRAGVNERIRLADADGRTHGVSADASGRFELTLPGGAPQDRLLTISVQRAGRAVTSDGRLYSPAAEPEHAVMLRPGTASTPVGAAPLLAVADYDGGGGLALSGVAEPDAVVMVTLDGQAQGQVQAGADGRWHATLSADVPPGEHSVSAEAGGQRVAAALNLRQAGPAAALEAHEEDGAIRIVWPLTGGGVQTTWILGL